MGAWGYGSFDNDSAMDWLGDVTDTDASIVGELLDDVAGAMTHLEDEDACAALAAAELVAAAHGKGDDRLCDTAAEWLAAHRSSLAAVELSVARRAVERVFASSELRDLMDESSDDGEWHAGVRELMRRLAA